MTRGDSLPAGFRDWLRTMPKEEVRRRLSHSTAQRIAIAGLSPITGGLATTAEELDERYFACQEAGKEDEAMSLFKQARLLSAQRLLAAGEDDEAVYEFFHSLDEATPEAAIAALQAPDQAPGSTAPGGRDSS